MNCPFCRSNKTEVYNSRHNKEQPYIWRRRRCLSCQQPFTTHETINTSFLSVTGKNGAKEPYMRLKLGFSILQACVNKDGSLEEVDHLVNVIETKLLDLKKTELTVTDIESTALVVLKSYNPAIFMRYLSNSSDFENLQQLKRELQNI